MSINLLFYIYKNNNLKNNINEKAN